VKRREFITLLGGAAAAWPLAARAQQAGRIARIGYLGLNTPLWERTFSEVFRTGMRDLGYVEGRNLHIEFRFAEGNEARLVGLAAELAALNVDVIVTYATGVFAAQRATATIPIVAAAAADLVAMGVVASLARPGGNVTGSTFFVPELYAKRLEVLKEVVPSLTRAGILLVRNNLANPNLLEFTRTTAKALKIGLQPIEVGAPTEYENAFSAWADQQVGGLVVTDHPYFFANFDALAALVTRYRLPSIGPLEWPASGGLIAYGVNLADLYRRAAAFVDKLLKGAKPQDIPVEQATRFKLILNLKIAKALGLEVPPTLLARADEVIE
jgi:putative tryptophan/tyrosine transport system substrate-binding protein